MSRDSESKSDVHPRRVSLDWRVEELAYLGKVNNLIEFLLNLPARHPEDSAVKENVFSTSQLGVKARTYLQQAGDTAVQHNAPPSWVSDTTKDL